ncbi:hypothetical protein BaRGS_00034779 [Batillaria attramentaria]|uniref:TIR domain-containing protein n=1 Tax=Batillaria attramentaria TaxID=370345 RepID=A0ABD0JGH9_9CAEN
MSSQSDGSQSHATVMAASSDPAERSLALGEESSFETKPPHHYTIDKGSVPGQSEKNVLDVSVLTFRDDGFTSKLLEELTDVGFQMYYKEKDVSSALCFKFKTTTKTESREDSPKDEVPLIRKQGVLSEEAAKLRYTIVHLDSKGPFGIRRFDHDEREKFKTLVHATEHQGSCLIFVIGGFYDYHDSWLAEKVGKWPSVIYDAEDEFDYSVSREAVGWMGWKGDSECSCIAKIISLVGNREGCPVRMLGPLQETLLESSSDPQRKVRVLYEPDSADFVLSKLRPAGLQVATHDLRSKITDAENDSSNDEDCRSLNALPHAVQGMHKSKYGAGCLTPSTLVVLNSDFYMLAARKILADQRTNHPLVIEMGGAGPDLNFYGTENCTVMVYPNHQPDKDEDFFHTLALLLADKTMDRKQRDMMNAFGLVRHAFFTSASDSEHGVHVVYSSDSSDQTFVLTQLKHVLETRFGLQQILPDTERTAGVSGEQKFFSAAQQCKHTLCILGSGTSVHEGRLEMRSNSRNGLLQSAVEEWEHPDALTVFIGRGETCPDWVLKRLETCTVMMYPRDQPDLDTLFWDTLSVLLADQTMDRKQRDMMNAFGLVGHAFFSSASESQHGVHVVYSSDSSDQNFVLTQLKHVLETRSAVEEWEHPDALTVFIGRGENCPGWVLNRLETCTVMMYPRDQPDLDTLFWDTLSVLLADQSMDRKQRDMMNAYGLVRHAFFTSASDSQHGVHVVYSSDSSDQTFVLTQLKHVLETRFGLQHILPDTESTAGVSGEQKFFSAAQQCKRTLCVLGSSTSVPEGWLEMRSSSRNVLLKSAVEEWEHPDVLTVFIGRGENCPDWVLKRLETCTVMMYPLDQPDLDTLFWDTLSVLLVCPTVDRKQLDMMNAFGFVRHAFFTSSSDSQHGVHVVYGSDSCDSQFVLTQLKQRLETRAGLQQILPDTEESAIVSGQQKFFSAAQQCKHTLCFLGSATEGALREKASAFTDGLVQGAVKEWENPDALTVFIGRGENCPDWVLKRLETCTVMMYPLDQPDLDTLFWDTLSVLLACPTVDRKQLDMMNAFGFVRHAFFTSSSDSQHGVHVVYGSDSCDSQFVLTQLKQRLETRAGLQQILPDTEESAIVSGQQKFFSAAQQCKHTLCLLGSATEGALREKASAFTDGLVQSAVKEWENPDALTVFIGRGENCPDWVLKRLETCTVMMYPLDQPDLDTLFWDTLSVLLTDQTMDRKQRDTVNAFGLVRHAFFTSISDSHNGVHVVYGSDQTFVLTQLKQGLETRLGLQQILPDTGRTAIYSGQKKIFSAAQQRMQTLCVLGPKDTTTVLLQKAVEESEHSDAHTVFILTGESCPDWVFERLETCIVVVYPGDHHKFEFFDGCKGHRNDSRHTVNSGLLGHVVFEPEHLSKDGIHVIFDRIYSEFILTHLRQELVTNFGLRMILQDTETNSRQTPKRTFEDVLNSCPNVLVVSMGSYDKLLAVLLQQTLRCRQEHTQKTLFVRSVGEKLPEWVKQWKIGRTDTCEVSLSYDVYSWNPKNARNRLFLKRLKTYFELPDLTPPVSSDNSNEKVNSAASAYQERSNTGGEQVLSPMSQLEYRGETTCTDSKDFVAEMLEIPEPIFSRRWEAVSRFSNSGGTFRKSGSDVILDVPRNAVEEDLQVTIHTAVCTDTDRVRRVLKLPEDECVSSPVAEYWAGHEFRFKKPVTITLPHFLPPDPDPSQTQDTDGQRSAHVTVHVWDRRLEITDFQQDFGIKTDDKIGETLSFRLSNFQDDLHESSLHVHFELVGRDIDIWQFCLRSNGSPATPAEQVGDLGFRLNCVCR